MRYAIVAVFVLACGGYVWRVEKQLRAMKLELNMADVNLVEGDTTLGRPQEVTWISASGTVKLKVFKASSTETAAQWTARVQSYTGQYQAPGQYPPIT